jgi:hypothetical protein
MKEELGVRSREVFCESMLRDNLYNGFAASTASNIPLRTDSHFQSGHLHKSLVYSDVVACYAPDGMVRKLH